jgi:hypothetical protein
MDEIKLSGVDSEGFNPFKASAEELLAYALDDAGLINPSTTINGRAAKDFLLSFYHKRENYREATKLGTLLVNQGVLTQEQLHEALKLHRSREGMKIGEALVSLKICTVEDIEKNLDAQIKIREDIRDLEGAKQKVDSLKERLRKYF